MPHNPLRTLQDRLRSDLAAIRLLAITLLRRRQLDVQPDQLLLQRNHHNRAGAGTVRLLRKGYAATRSDGKQNRKDLGNVKFDLGLKCSWVK
jgi:hypothetical protein